MGEFGMGDFLGPGRGVGATEDAEVSLHFLVDSFSFSVGLGMVGGRKEEVIV